MRGLLLFPAAAALLVACGASEGDPRSTVADARASRDAPAKRDGSASRGAGEDALAAHGDSPGRDAPPPSDAAGRDASVGNDDAGRDAPPAKDAALLDGAVRDAARLDASVRDAARLDASVRDAARLDASVRDAALLDAPVLDAARRDATVRDDAAPRDASADRDTADSSEPALLSLTVSPLTLSPAFSPSIHDYYVRCAAGTNALTVTTAAASGGTVALVSPVVTAASTGDTVSLDVTENQAIVVSAALGSTSSEYWVRCLPQDFPRLSMTLHPDAGAVVPGYYLVGDTFYPRGELGYAMVLDVHGTPVWYGVTSTGGGAADVDLLLPGTLSFASVTGAGWPQGPYELHALEPVGVTYPAAPVDAPLDTHELRVLPNGDYLVFASTITTGVDLTGLRGSGITSSTYGANASILNCVIQEVTPAGQLVWEWTATDHFDPVAVSEWPQMVLDGIVDVFHCNSIDFDDDGDLLVSGRQMNSIFLISKSTGEVVWKMGGAASSLDDTAFIEVIGDALGGFHGQHHVRFQPGGTLSMFDDESDQAGPARALLLSYDVDAGTASVAWEFSGVGTAGSMGSFTILPDGSRVIGWGDGPAPAFSEVTEEGAVLLDFSFPEGDSSYRAIKVPTSALDLAALRAAVGPWSSELRVVDAGADAHADAHPDAHPDAHLDAHPDAHPDAHADGS